MIRACQNHRQHPDCKDIPSTLPRRCTTSDKRQNHNGGQSHNGRIDGNKGNVVSNIGDNATHNTEFGSTSNVAEGGQGTFNAPVTRGNLGGNHQHNFGSAQGSQNQGGVKAETITGLNGK